MPMPTTLKNAVCIALMGVASAALHAQEPTLRKSPMNEKFLEWQEKHRVEAHAQAERAELRGNVSGYIPMPFLFPKTVGPATEIEAMVKSGAYAYPATYDLRTQGILSPVRNQNPFGTCWVFAAFASLESNIRKNTGTAVDLSEWHLAWFAYNPVGGFPAFTKGSVEAGEDPTFDQGGNTLRAVAIASRGTGPVLEAYAPYQNTRSYPQSARPVGTEPTAATLKDYFMLETEDADTIKGLVQTYGPVSLSVLWPTSGESTYYNSATRAFRYRQGGSVDANHGVNIVGWDDNFAPTNFPAGNQPPAPGAWIIRNSWGSAWGEAGYYYQSYDTQFLSPGAGVGRLQLDGRTYQYDPLGMAGGLGYGNNTAWFANVFTAQANDRVTDVAFYTGEQNTSYEITVKTGVTAGPDTGSIAFGPQTGTQALPGYHRVQLSSPVNVGSGTKFAVIVKIVEPTRPNNYPIPIVYPIADYTDSHTAQTGVGFISSNGSSWSDIRSLPSISLENVSICLKALAVPATVQAIQVSVSPATATMASGETLTFSAAVTGGSGNTNVTWTATGGSITQGGVYTAPNTQGTYTVRATSVEDSAKSGTATVTVVPASISLVDPAAVVFVGETVAYQASVGGPADKTVTWACTAGSIDAAGRFTAPASAQTVTITATSVANNSLKATLSVSVRAHLDGCTSKDPQLLGLANAYGSTAGADLSKYDLTGDGRINDLDITALFKGLGW